MTLFKSLFLGATAGIVAVAGAQAADLPMAEPVEYVKICDAYGNGFFYLPGTETCLKIGGTVRVEAVYSEPNDDTENKVDFHARARVMMDARTATEYGLLRSFARLSFDRETGPSNSPGRIDYYAFIQFAGITAGVNQSFFDYAVYPSYAGMLTSDIATIMFAYTAQFGDGFSATLAAEDTTYRRDYNLSDGGSFPAYAGAEMPDFVANLRVEQGWGNAQLSAAVHQIDTVAFLDPNLRSRQVDDEYGWAVQGGVTINLPMIAEDDYIYASGAYAEGALSYLISGAGVGQAGQNDVFGAPVSDYTLKANLRDFNLTSGFNVNGGFEHHWSPNWKSTVSASYADIDYPGKNSDWALVQVAGQTIWTPVTGLDIGLEVVYSRFTDKPKLGQSAFANPDNWSGRIRVERGF